MTAKDFLNVKKPHFWVSLVIILLLIFAGVVSILDKEEEIPVEVPPAEEIVVEVEEAEKVKKTDKEIILERFTSMDWEEVKKNAKDFGEEGWENGIVVLAKLPEAGITLYGYNDEEYKLRGAAVDYNGNVNYFDWVYTSNKTYIQPEMYWNAQENQLQITLNLYEGEGVNAEELHVLVVYDTMTMEDFVLRSEDYLAEIQDRMAGTATQVGAYVDIKLGKNMMLVFEPVKTVDGETEVLKLHQAMIYLNPSKDGFIFEIGDIGVEPEKRTASVEIEGIQEEYIEVQYISENGYELWFPGSMMPATIHGHEGFTNKPVEGESNVQVLLVPEGDMTLNESYLKEAAGNFKESGEYKKVTVSKVKTLKADDKDVAIKMIEVVHDDTADRFYMVKGKEAALLITVTMDKEALEGWGVRVDHMIQTIGFETQKETV